jgi:hypothetical protein
MHFFQKRLLHPKVNVWYAAQPIGKNTLASMMSTISNEAGLSVRYTNHCIMATVATGSKGSGVDDLSIMSVTGHRNVKSLESYIAGPTEQQRRELSHTLRRRSETQSKQGKSFSLFVDHIDVYCSTAYCFLTKLV